MDYGHQRYLERVETMEALNYEIEVPCPLQQDFFSPQHRLPTNLNHKFVNNGTKIDK